MRRNCCETVEHHAERPPGVWHFAPMPPIPRLSVLAAAWPPHPSWHVAPRPLPARYPTCWPMWSAWLHRVGWQRLTRGGQTLCAAATAQETFDIRRLGVTLSLTCVSAYVARASHVSPPSQPVCRLQHRKLNQWGILSIARRRTGYMRQPSIAPVDCHPHR